MHEFSYQFPYQALRFGEKNQVALSTEPPDLITSEHQAEPTLHSGVMLPQQPFGF